MRSSNGLSPECDHNISLAVCKLTYERAEKQLVTSHYTHLKEFVNRR